MNIKLSLLITLATLSGSINTETIRERLLSKKEAANQELEYRITRFQKNTRYNRRVFITENNVPKIHALKVKIRRYDQLLECINKENWWTLYTQEKQVAQECFNQLTKQELSNHNKIIPIASFRGTRSQENEDVPKKLKKMKKDLKLN